MKVQCLSVLQAVFLCFGIFHSASPCVAGQYIVNDQVYDDETVANLITVITTTNPIPSIPDVWHLFNCQESLFKIPAFALCKKIIVFDGVQPAYEKRSGDYEQYKQNVIELTKNHPHFSNTQLVFCSEWVHLAGAVKEAMKLVTTPFVFIHQHDFSLVKSFDLNGVIATMVANPNVKHVRLCQNQRADDYPPFDGPVDQVIKGPHFIPLCRCFGWSDNDHVSTVDYYDNFVFPRCNGRVAMEWKLQDWFQEEISLQGHEAAHPAFGTYIYGEMDGGPYIFHTDGRNCGPDLIRYGWGD